MPPFSFPSIPQQPRTSSRNPFEGRILLAQLTPADSGVATDAGPPPVVSDAGTAMDANPTPPPPPPPPASSTPVRIPLAQIQEASRERATILSESHLLGPQFEAYQRDPARYQVLRDAMVMIQYYIEGRHPDLFTSRPTLLNWLRATHTSGDTVLVESVGNILTALNELRTDLNRARGEAMSRQIAQIQQLFARPTGTPSVSEPVPVTSPTPGTSRDSSSAPNPAPSAASSDASVSTLRRRSERAVARAETTCSATPTERSCVTARTSAARAAAAYRDAVCGETPRAVACTLARAQADSARAARDEARSAAGSAGTAGSGSATPNPSTPPPPPPAPGDGAP